MSVIVPARNAEGVLAECLAALAAESSRVRPCEVIVVDDGSTDATAAVAESHGARVVRIPGRGPAAARNAGARAALGDVLIFFDADCAPEAGTVDALVGPFADPCVVGVRGGYTTRQRAIVARFTQLELDEKQDRLASSPQVSVMDSACVAYRRMVFTEYGGFDERFPATSAEDAELSFRLAAGGERLLFAPGARVRHHHPERLGRYFQRKLRFGFFRAQLYRRYPARLRNDGYTPRLMPLQIGLAGLIVGLAALSPWLSAALPLAFVAAVAFVASSTPLVRRSWKSDRRLVAFVPGLLFARSLAQGLSLTVGLLLSLGQVFGRRSAAEVGLSAIDRGPH